MSWKDCGTQRTANELEELIDVCKGGATDLIIQGGNLVNVHFSILYRHGRIGRYDDHSK